MSEPGTEERQQVTAALAAHPYVASFARGVERCACGESRVGEPGWHTEHLADVLLAPRGVIEEAERRGGDREFAHRIAYGTKTGALEAYAYDRGKNDGAAQAQALLETLERVRRAQRDRAEAIRSHLPTRNVALEAHVDSIDNALGGPHVLAEVTETPTHRELGSHNSGR